MLETGFEKNKTLNIDTVGTSLFDTCSLSSENPPEIYMLEAFQLQDFKVFRNTGWIKLNRLTLLLGNNSSGKSALFQALQMLSAAYSRLIREEKFSSLSGLSEVFGSFSDICSKTSENYIVKFAFRFVSDSKTLEYHIYFGNSPDEYGQVTDVFAKEGTQHIDFLQYYNSVNIFFLERKAGFNIPEDIEKKAGCCLLSLGEFAKTFQIISAHRSLPERTMQLAGTSPRHIDLSGHDVYEMLYALSEIQGKEFSLVRKWLEKFGYTYHWKMSGMNRGEFILKDIKTGIESNLVDNGFGISQSLPLAAALDTLQNRTLLVDSPEAFLQTNMQSELGDLLIEGSRQGRILLETGSEYLLLRMQRRIAEEILSPEEITVYFLEDNTEQGTVIYTIPIDENGNFQNTPPAFIHFFSSDYNDLEKLDEVRRKKEKHAAEHSNRH